jgi:alkylation response protein AidB-like acyl-CoA dehydrogenase
MRRHGEAGSCDRELWASLADLGILELLAPESAGGAGGQPADAFAVHREVGRTLAPVPLLQHNAVVYLMSLLGQSPPAALCSPLIDSEGLTWTTGGKRLLLPFAEAVDSVLVGFDVGGGNIDLRLVPCAALQSRRVESIDLTFPLWEVSLPGEPTGTLVCTISKDWVPALLDQTVAFSRAALCAEMLGGAERCLEVLIEHLKTREQFGRPIGSFQAVQHKAADMAIRLEGMRAMRTATEEPAALSSAADPTSQMAKAYISDGYRWIAETCLQLYGGIGFTWEHDVHLYLRHARRCGQMLGDPKGLRAMFVRSL